MYNPAGNYIEKENDYFNVGIYARLSREDDASYSVENQIKLLKPIVLSNSNWTLIDIYFDDGVSGTTFDRPDFNRLMDDVNTKKVNLIILKDLSRLGRNLYESEKFFDYCLLNNVRIITVNDKIDSFNHDTQTNFVRPLTCLLNEKYAADVSANIKSIFSNKRKRGEFIGAFAPYGYQKDTQNKNKLVINPETCDIVRRIYKMFIGGESLHGISTILNKEHVLSPASYKVSTTLYRGGKTKSFLWNPETIKVILTSPTYIGSVSQGKTEKISFKRKKYKYIPRENWIIVENTHEAIISKEDFEVVQVLMSKKNYHSNKVIQPHILSGLVYCGDCGEKLTFTRTGKYFYTMCSKYKRYSECTRHTFSEDKLYEIIKHELKAIAQKFLDIHNLTNIANNYNKNQINSDNGNALITARKEIKTIENRLADIKRHLLAAYQDKSNGELSVSDYLDISNLLAEEKQGLNARLELLHKQLETNTKQDDSSKSLQNIIDTFASFESLDRLTVVKLINKIEIFEDRTVKIHYNFKNPF